MNNHNGDRVIENRFARTLRELRWRNGRLQTLHEYKYEQYADNMGKKGRFIGSGVRSEWNDVPGFRLESPDNTGSVPPEHNSHSES